jgi:hypothetical protein
VAATPIHVDLRTEAGDVLARLDDPCLFRDILPRHDDRSFACLRFVDPWGDTVFNRAQANELLAELDRIQLPPDIAGLREWVAELRALVERCATDVHLYIRCTGY